MADDYIHKTISLPINANYNNSWCHFWKVRLHRYRESTLKNLHHLCTVLEGFYLQSMLWNQTGQLTFKQIARSTSMKFKTFFSISSPRTLGFEQILYEKFLKYLRHCIETCKFFFQVPLLNGDPLVQTFQFRILWFWKWSLYSVWASQVLHDASLYMKWMSAYSLNVGEFPK